MVRTIIFAAALLACSWCGAHTDSVEVDVVRIIDGDTIEVNIPNWPEPLREKMKIRLLGVDTPELRGKCQAEKVMAQKAAYFVEIHLREAQRVWLTDVGRGSFFRLVAYVHADGANLSELLLEKGLAVPYKRGVSHGWCG